MARKVKSVHSTQDTVQSGIVGSDNQMQNGQQVQDEKLKELEELKNRLARALADYQNLVKRFAREKEEVIFRANQSLVADLLPVVDNIERAQTHLQDTGLQMALDQFLKILQDYGVEQIQVSIGEAFDSDTHEVIESMNGGEKETVAQVLTKGYKWKSGGVIRPAKVIVYKN